MLKGRRAVAVFTALLTVFALFLICISLSMPVPRGGEASGHLLARLLGAFVLIYMNALTDIAAGAAALVALLLSLVSLRSPVKWVHISSIVILCVDSTCLLLAIGHAVYVFISILL